MTNGDTSRRNALRLAIATAGAAIVALPSREALAYQGNMDRAIGSLEDALNSLREATPDKGGHREKAMELIRQAIEETRAGIEFAREHFGD